MVQIRVQRSRLSLPSALLLFLESPYGKVEMVDYSKGRFCVSISHVLMQELCHYISTCDTAVGISAETRVLIFLGISDISQEAQGVLLILNPLHTVSLLFGISLYNFRGFF